MDEFRDWLERQLKNDERLLLGYLTWYSVTGVTAPHDHLVRALINAGLDSNLPLPPKDDNVFRRVSAKAERKRVPTSDEGIYENFLVREVGYDDENVYRRIVAEKVDGKGRKLGYEQLYDVTFHRPTAQIIARQLGPTSVVATEMVEMIKQLFVRERGTLNSYAVREWLRHFVVSLNGTPTRSGGVYFVAVKHKDKIEALKKFAAAVRPGDVRVHVVPLIDDRDQREMLRNAYEADTSDAIDKLLTEINEIRTKNRKITQARYEEFLNSYHALTEKTTEYGELLEEKLSTTHSRLDIFMKSMLALTSSHVKY